MKDPIDETKNFEEEMQEFNQEELPEESRETSKSESKAEFKLEMYLSTDGKHTVHVIVDKPEDRREAVSKAMEMYDYVLARYGTKQAQAVKEYGNGKTPEVQKEDQESCDHTQFKFLQVKKEGPNTGKWFKTCVKCQKFLGWQ